jgi:hypothetical protein
MGIEYDLYDLKHRERFYLGKVGRVFYDLKHDVGFDGIRAMGIEAFARTYADATVPADAPSRPWFERQAKMLFVFCEHAEWSLELRSDASYYDDDEEREQWSCAGSMYRITRP